MRVAANLNFFFQEVPLLERYAKAAAAGFRLVELPFPYTENAEALKQAADRHGIQHSMINAPIGDTKGLAAIASSSEMETSVEKAVEYAKALHCHRIHVMAGATESTNASKKLYLENIALAAKRFEEEGITCLIEPINKHTVPGYFLNSYEQAQEVIGELNLPNLKIQFDVFHAQLTCGQLTTLAKSLSGHIVAQAPDRHEPASPGEINYAYVFKMLSEINNDWVIGCEYSPTNPDDRSWVKMYSLEF